jgi:glycosyltransferase involved in cell wall biosynthesis
MKIMHILNTNRFSGAENVVCQIIGMFQNDSDVEMVYCSRDGQIRDALAERGIRFVPIRDMSVKEIKRVIKEEKPDVVHAHDMRASFLAARACGKVRLISHIHNNAFNSRGLSLKSVAYLWAAIKAKHIFWVSQSAYEGYFFGKLFAKKSSVLYNIIDVDALYMKKALDTKDYDFDVAYVGRLSYPKNPQKLMHVFAKVVERLPNVKIAVVGNGELEEETKRLCEELNLQSNVSFLGFQSNPLKILGDAKVMVMTSRWEGTPMCALESMALGTPIVSTPTDGLCELVADGENGFLSDDEKELAEKICLLVTDAQLQEEFSNAIKEKAVRINEIASYKAEMRDAYVDGIK